MFLIRYFYRERKLDDSQHVIAAINLDLSFGFQPMPVAKFLNSFFFDDKTVFFQERNNGYGQMGLFNLIDSAVSNSFGQKPVLIWNFRGNALLNSNSKQMELIMSSASSILVFLNENCVQNNEYLNHVMHILDKIKSAIGKVLNKNGKCI